MAHLTTSYALEALRPGQWAWRPDGLAAFRSKHLNSEGFSLAWDTEAERWPIVMANQGIFSKHLA